LHYHNREDIGIMRTMLSSITALLFGAFLLLAGSGLTNTLIPVRADIAQFSSLAIGAIGTGQFIGFVLGCLICPLAVRRAGHIRSFATFAGIAACSILILPISINPYAWPILRGLFGFCYAGLFMVIESWLNERATNEYRGRIFSIYQVVALLGALAGQQLLGIGQIDSYELFSYATVLLILAMIPLSLTASGAPRPLQAVRPRIMWLITQSPVAVIGCALVGMANGALWSMGPVYAHKSGLSIVEVGWFMSAVIAGGALTQWPIGRISDQFDRRWVIIGASTCSALIGVSFLVVEATGLEILLLKTACYGGFSLVLYSLCVAHVNDLVNPEDFIHVSSGMLLMFGAGAIGGPMLASALMEATSHSSLFLFTAGCHSAIALFAIYRVFIRPRKISLDRDPFVISMPRPSPVMSSLDPRADNVED